MRGATKDSGPYRKPNRVIDGYQAVYSDQVAGRIHREELYVLDVKGLSYFISYSSLEGNGAERIWRSLKTYGADPAKWTDRPVG